MRDKSLAHWYTQTEKGQKYRKPLSNHESHIDTTPVDGTLPKGRSLLCESLGKASYDFQYLATAHGLAGNYKLHAPIIHVFNCGFSECLFASMIIPTM